MFNYLKNLFKRQPKVPKESIRSLMIEGVIKVVVEQKDWDNQQITITAPFPLLKFWNNDDKLVVAYIDGSSPTVIDDNCSGLVKVGD